MAAKTWPDSMSGGDTPGQGAAAIALAIRAGQMTAREAVEACIGRIKCLPLGNSGA